MGMEYMQLMLLWATSDREALDQLYDKVIKKARFRLNELGQNQKLKARLSEYIGMLESSKDMNLEALRMLSKQKTAFANFIAEGKSVDLHEVQTLFNQAKTDYSAFNQESSLLAYILNYQFSETKLDDYFKFSAASWNPY